MSSNAQQNLSRSCLTGRGGQFPLTVKLNLNPLLIQNLLIESVQAKTHQMKLCCHRPALR